jgi:hypothetical protein
LGLAAEKEEEFRSKKQFEERRIVKLVNDDIRD